MPGIFLNAGHLPSEFGHMLHSKAGEGPHAKTQGRKERKMRWSASGWL